MNELFERLGYRTSGFLLLAITAGLTAVALMTMFFAVFRWMAVADLADNQLAILGRDRSAAVEAARDAAQAMPGDAVAVVPSLDLAKDEDLRRLDRLAAKARPLQRDALQAAAGLGLALQGKPATGVPGDDGALLAYLATLNSDGGAAAPKLAGDAPPHRGILTVALLSRFQAAWLAGNPAAIRDAAGPLLLLDPHQPDAGRLRALLLVLSSQPGALAANTLTTQLTGMIIDATTRLALVRQLIKLSPGQKAELSASIPPDQQTSAERSVGLSAAIGRLDDLVKQALQHPDEEVLRGLLPRAIADGRIDLARPMFALLRADHRQAFAAALAQAEGDLDTLVRLGGDPAALQARISAPLVANGRMSFHLATTAGIIPRAAIEVRLDGRPLPADKVERFASLVVAEIGGATTVPYEVRLAGKLIASGKLGQ